jgi:hypothetical protein
MMIFKPPQSIEKYSDWEGKRLDQAFSAAL